MNFFNVNLFGFQTINFISIKRFAQELTVKCKH